MSERMLNAALTVKRTLQFYGNNSSLVSITAELRTLSHYAHNKYLAHLENTKIEKEKQAKIIEENLK